jgi:hypothetical protein
MLEVSMETQLPTGQRERRAMRRFALHVPMSLTRVDSVRINQSARSHDISTRGVRFFTSTELRPGSMLEFVLSVPSEITGSDAIYVRCQGTIIRGEREPDGSGVLVAATIERQDFISAAEFRSGGASTP